MPAWHKHTDRVSVRRCCCHSQRSLCSAELQVFIDPQNGWSWKDPRGPSGPIPCSAQRHPQLHQCSERPPAQCRLFPFSSHKTKNKSPFKLNASVARERSDREDISKHLHDTPLTLRSRTVRPSVLRAEQELLPPPPPPGPPHRSQPPFCCSGPAPRPDGSARPSRSAARAAARGRCARSQDALRRRARRRKGARRGARRRPEERPRSPGAGGSDGGGGVGSGPAGAADPNRSALSAPPPPLAADGTSLLPFVPPPAPSTPVPPLSNNFHVRFHFFSRSEISKPSARRIVHMKTNYTKSIFNHSAAS